MAIIFNSRRLIVMKQKLKFVCVFMMFIMLLAGCNEYQQKKKMYRYRMTIIKVKLKAEMTS